MPNTELSRRTLLATAATASLAVPLARARAADAGSVELVATFTEPHQVTGVAVAPDGRIFVNFPRWEQDVSMSVAEVGKDGKLTPYPDAEWNSFRAAEPEKAAQRFVCVQSVTCDPQGNLWVLDPAAPGIGARGERRPQAAAHRSGEEPGRPGLRVRRRAWPHKGPT